jgi:two-component system NtrC family sensor kinase
MKWKSIKKFVISGLDLEDVFSRQVAYASPFVVAIALVSGVVTLRNVARRKRAEEEREHLREQLIFSDRKANLGQLVLGIAHEFNNLLGSLRGYAHVAQMPGKEKRLNELPEVVIEMADRAQGIAENLQGFSERIQPPSEIVRPAKMIASIIKLMKPALETAQIKVKIDIPEDAAIKTDGNKLQQVLLNLIINAQHAMPEGGTLSFKMKKQGDSVQLHVSDTGVGIPEDALPRIFEPFFTTKGPLGTGLGLNISSSIMLSLGGGIEVKSREKQGSAFIIYFPARSDTSGAEM